MPPAPAGKMPALPEQIGSSVLPAARKSILSAGEAGDDGPAAARLIVLIAQRAVGANHRDDIESVELDAVPRAFAHRPDQHAFLAAEAHLRIGETRAGINVARPHLQIIAGDG